ncbi:MAG: hypothetical protein V1685_01685, partial [Parcubacteria group bacterium]
NTNTVDSNTNTDVDAFDYDQNYNMDCDDWRADSDTFVPPSDVTFTDLTAQLEAIQNLTNSTNGSTAAQCAVCDASTDAETRDACRQALGCE